MMKALIGGNVSAISFVALALRAMWRDVLAIEAFDF